MHVSMITTKPCSNMHICLHMLDHVVYCVTVHWTLTELYISYNMLDQACHAQVLIQITDSCDWTTPTCATNFDQFNIDYEAFSALAHPGYGLMNVQYR